MEKVALNADIVGYSRAMADDPGRTVSIVDDYHRLVGQVVVENHGVLTSFVGDNFMALFDDPMDALRSAIAVTTAIEQQNETTPPERELKFRMGLDQGPVEERGDDFLGEALNVAARIQAVAPEGGLSVSDRIYKAIDEPALRFRPRGPTRLKNIPEPVDVYDFVDLPTGDTGGPPTSGLRVGPPTVAVLPMHARPEEEPLLSVAEMLRSEIVHALVGVPDLSVVEARETTTPSGESARYFVESGLNQLGETVRVYVETIDVITMNVVKAQKWTADLAGISDLAETVGSEVARTLQIELVVGEPAGLYMELDDPVAVEKIYLGWYHLNKGTPEGWAESLRLFSDVAEMHPDHSFGHVLYAFAQWVATELGIAPDRDMALREAYEAAQRGLVIGDPTGLAPMVIATVLLSEGKANDALEMMEGVTITRPTCDVTYGIEGSVRRYVGEYDRAVTLMDTAMRLSGPTKPWYPTVKACSLFLGGQSGQASSLAQAVVERQPDNLEALLVLAGAQVEQGLVRRAGATAQLIKERFPGVDVESWIDSSPFQNRDAVTRWKHGLATIGLIDHEGLGESNPEVGAAKPG
jgi:adenylate cyclase